MTTMNNNPPMKTDYVIGADIGGSHITAGLVNIAARTMEHGSVVRRTVDPHAPANDIMAAWSETIQEAARFFDGASYRVGIAMPGPFDYANGISLIRGFNKYESLYELNVKEMFAQQLGIPGADIRLKNDAAAFLQGEVFCGAAMDYGKAVGITLGTGLGSARTINGDTEEGAVNVSPLHDSIAEDYISTRWFLKRYTELTGNKPKDVRSLAEKLGQDADAGRVFREFTANLAIVLQQFITEEQPEVVVLGGGIANAFDIFYPQLRELLAGKINNTVIKRSSLGESAAMIGAASIFGKKPVSSAVK
jgi:glucokinase